MPTIYRIQLMILNFSGYLLKNLVWLQVSQGEQELPIKSHWDLKISTFCLFVILDILLIMFISE